MKILKTANFDKIAYDIDYDSRSDLASHMLRYFYASDLLYSNYGNESSIYTVAQSWLSNEDVSFELIKSAIDEVQFDINTRTKRGRKPKYLKYLLDIKRMIEEQMSAQKLRTTNYEKCGQCGEAKHLSEFSNDYAMCQTCSDKLQSVRDRGYY